MSVSSKKDLVLLTILDGWGLAVDAPGNAISLAKTPNLDRFWASFPHSQLSASGEAVGLPHGEVGNTETGHLNLGAGRIVYQDLARINMSIADGTFYQNKVLIEAFEHAKKNNSKLHLIGLIGAGGVHSNLEHLFALIDFAKRLDFKNLFLHLFTDGRDSPPTSAKTYISKIREVILKKGIGQIASIMGRYWAMDRDLRWERTAKAYFALTKGEGQLVKTPEEAIDMSYSQGKTDEFIEPALVGDFKPVAKISDNDSVIFFNFRIDRPRQLTRAFVFEDFTKANLGFEFDPYATKYQKKHVVDLAGAKVVGEPFVRGPKIKNLFFTMMTQYSKASLLAGAKVAFPPEIVEMPLGRVISEAGYRQLRCTESEKERFVTFYFNGQQEVSFPGEERTIIPSPKVPTYDLKPEMSAYDLTEEVMNQLRNHSQYKFILINFANPDMVGHTGNIGAAVKACEVVDECVGKIANFILAYDATMIVTADHGNCEEMINPSTGEIETEHSANPVPFIVLSKEYLGKPQTLTSGILADVAPTVLSLLGLQIPESMTGRNLLEEVV